MSVAVHGDDFLSTGPRQELQWFRKQLETVYEIKTKVLGPGKDENQEVRILNRILSWTEEGIQYEADPRHSEIMIHKVDCRKAIRTPGVKEGKPVGGVKEEWQDKMRGADATKYRGWTARCN